MICSLDYYFETNALFHLSKFNNDVIKKSFTSALSVLELITGLNRKNFSKRKVIAILILKSKIIIDWRFPEEIVMDSFDSVFEYEFDELRLEPLQVMLILLSKSKNYDGFLANVEKEEFDFNLDFFLELDKSWTSRFMKATNKGNADVNKILKCGGDIVEIDSDKYKIENRKDLEKFLIERPDFNVSITILALTKMTMNFCKFEHLNEEDVYSSFNGFVTHFVSSYSYYSAMKMVKSESASKNDVMDLYHLIYLRDCPKTKIVSNDKIYSIYAKNMSIELDNLLK